MQVKHDGDEDDQRPGNHRNIVANVAGIVGDEGRNKEDEAGDKRPFSSQPAA